MKEYIFNNMAELDNFLNNLDDFVPPRSKGRKTEHTEKYSLKSFFLQTKNELFNEFPLKLIHSDKPDIRVFTKSKSIGLEITESIPEQLARAIALLEENFPEGGKLEPEFFGWDAPERNNAEILEILEKSNEKLIGNGYYGNSIEEEWVQGILGCIKNKTTKLNKDGFEKLKENWLIIYDNQSRSFLNKELVSDKLTMQIDKYYQNTDVYFFTKIIVESGKYFFFIDNQSVSLIKIVAKNVG